MSYTQNYRASVSYSGHKTVNYPASENGGSKTVYYEGSVPINVAITVDTSDFDTSVYHCNNQINTLTASVVAMNAAQVASINKTSQEISSSISNGFFKMIKSELSQNMVALFSKIQSAILLIKEKSDFLENQLNIMQNDYARIMSRYSKVFSDLDEEARRRIFDLDRFAFYLGTSVKQRQITEVATNQSVKLITNMNEQDYLRQKLSQASMNIKTKNTMKKIADYINQEKIYSKKLENIIRDKTYQNETKVFIPVVFCESDNIENEDITDSYGVTTDVSLFEKDTINEKTCNYFSQNYSTDDTNAEEQEFVKNAFNKLFESKLNLLQEDADEHTLRVFEMIRKLKEQNHKGASNNI